MVVVNHIIEDVGNFQVEYVNDISYEDIKEILVHLKNNSNRIKDSGFEAIGCGSSASVYGYKHYAVKKLFEERTYGESRDNDVEVLKDLGHLNCIPTLYAVIDDNIMIVQRVKGLTVAQYCRREIKNEKIIVDDNFVEKWDDILLDVIANGYSPSDLHEHNVMIEEETSNPIIVDAGWFFKHNNEYDRDDKDSLKSDDNYSRANAWAGRTIRDYVSDENRKREARERSGMAKIVNAGEYTLTNL